eukprot:1196429-Prorocentrum_minimum.AAC.3
MRNLSSTWSECNNAPPGRGTCRPPAAPGTALAPERAPRRSSALQAERGLGFQPLGLQPLGLLPLGMQPTLGLQPLGLQPTLGFQPLGLQPLVIVDPSR